MRKIVTSALGAAAGFCGWMAFASIVSAAHMQRWLDDDISSERRTVETVRWTPLHLRYDMNFRRVVAQGIGVAALGAVLPHLHARRKRKYGDTYNITVEK